MKYLLDVNALIAFGLIHHQFHGRVNSWVQSQHDPRLFSCSITELGFVRIAAQAPLYGFTVEQARNLLLQLKKNPPLPLEFITDGNDITFLPAWVKTPGQTTDGHLAQLARSNGAVLATFDRGIPGVLQIP